MTNAYFLYVPTGSLGVLPRGAAVISAHCPEFCETVELSWAADDGMVFAESARVAVAHLRRGDVLVVPSARLALVARYDADSGSVLPYGVGAEALLTRWCEPAQVAKFVVDWELCEQIELGSVRAGVAHLGV